MQSHFEHAALSNRRLLIQLRNLSVKRRRKRLESSAIVSSDSSDSKSEMTYQHTDTPDFASTNPFPSPIPPDQPIH
jgi:hypothetical protein